MSDYKIKGEYVVVERNIQRFSDDEYRISVILKDKNYRQKYGDIFNNYSRDIGQLNIRENTIILNVTSQNESINLSEYLLFSDRGLVAYATDTDYLDGVGDYPFYATI